MTSPRPGDVGTIRIGVSACLLGQEVRFDGGHKRDDFLTIVLGPFVEWVPVCPEVEIGLGVPRDTLRLIGDEAAPRLVVQRTGEDLTGRMRRYAAVKIRELEALHLDGYVLKRASPSCGLFRVRVYSANGMSRGGGRGIFAQELARRLPMLPIEEARASRATRARHTNVLQHLAGFFKRQLGPGERAELAEVIEDYRSGLFPLVVPITLIRHHVRRFGVSYLADQTYLNPHPKELMLRNHV